MGPSSAAATRTASAKRAMLGFALLGVAAVLAGCGGGEADSLRSGTTAAPRTTVIVMRHCVRSTKEEGIDAVPGLNFYDNYSSQAWPGFPVRPMLCLPRGLALLEAQGRWLAANGDLPQPWRFVTDTATRDIETAHAVMRGMGLAVADPSVEDRGYLASACPEPSMEERVAAREAQLRKLPWQEPRFMELLEELFQVLGEGVAGNWTETPCEVSNETGHLAGPCQAAGHFVERLLMEWGGGLELGWGRLASWRIPALLELQAWRETVKNAAPALAARSQASVTRALLSALEAGEQGTFVLVGHDTELSALKGALGMTWDPAPFPPNATMPGSGLRFDRERGGVRVSYTFVANLSDTSGRMRAVPAAIGGSAAGEVTMSTFRALAEQGSVAACANPPPQWPAGLRSGTLGAASAQGWAALALWGLLAARPL